MSQNRILGETKVQIQQILALAFENYKSLDESSLSGILEVFRPATGHAAPALEPAVKLYTLLHDILSPEAQTALCHHFQVWETFSLFNNYFCSRYIYLLLIEVVWLARLLREKDQEGTWLRQMNMLPTTVMELWLIFWVWRQRTRKWNPCALTLGMKSSLILRSIISIYSPGMYFKPSSGTFKYG